MSLSGIPVPYGNGNSETDDKYLCRYRRHTLVSDIVLANCTAV
jgi:hypothetical protein